MTDREFQESVKRFLLNKEDKDAEKKIRNFCENKYKSTFIDNIYKKINNPEKWIVAAVSSYCVHLITNDFLLKLALSVPLSATLSEIYRVVQEGIIKNQVNSPGFPLGKILSSAKAINASDRSDQLVYGLQNNVLLHTPRAPESFWSLIRDAYSSPGLPYSRQMRLMIS